MAELLMNALLGKPKDTNPTKTKQVLKENSDDIEKRIVSEQGKVNALRKEAVQLHKSGHKSQALIKMKLVKMKEKYIERLSNEVFNVLQTSEQIDQMVVMKDTFKALKTARTTLRSLNKEIKIEEVDDVMQDLNDSMMDANDVSEALGTPLDAGITYDDDELLSELDGLEASSLEDDFFKLEAKEPAKKTINNIKEPVTVSQTEDFDYEEPQQRPPEPIKKKQPLKKPSYQNPVLDELAGELY